MGEYPVCNPFFIIQTLCASKIETLQKFSATAKFAGARPLIRRIVAVRAPLEEQQKSAKFIADYMKQSKSDTVQKLHHHMTFSYKDNVLRKRLMKNVEILEGYQPNPKPLQVMQWDENQLLDHLRYVERQLSPMNVFNLVMPHKPSVAEPARINAFEIGANSGVPGPSIIHLRSSDGREIAVELAVALKSDLIGNYLVDVDSCPDFDSCSSIKLPNVDSTTLEMVIDFCKQHIAVETAISVQDPKFSARVEDSLSSIAAEFLNVNPETLADIISAADYMQIPLLLDFAFQKFVHLIEDSSPEQLCQLLDVTYFCDVEEKDPVDWEDMAPVDMENIIRKLKQQTSDQRFC